MRQLEVRLAIACALVLGAACETSDGEWDLGGVGPAERQAASADPGTFALVKGRSYGDAGGDASLAYPAAMAAHSSGILAVTDAPACDISLIDTATFSLIRRFGQCGDGPGEMRGIGALTFSADTLIAYDIVHSALELFTLEGHFLRRVGVTAGSLTGLAPFRPGTILASVSRRALGAIPDSARGDQQYLLAEISTLDGSVRGWHVRDSESSMRNPANFTRFVTMCSPSSGQQPRIALQSQWQFEGAILLGHDLASASHFIVDLGQTEIMPVASGEGVRPAARRPDPLCGDELIWFRRAYWKPVGEGMQLVGGRSEFRYYDGTLAAAIDVATPDSSALIGTGTALGKAFYRIIFWGDVPRIQEFRLERKPIVATRVRSQ